MTNEQEIENIKKAIELLARICSRTEILGCAYVDEKVHHLLYHSKKEVQNSTNDISEGFGEGFAGFAKGG